MISILKIYNQRYMFQQLYPKKNMGFIHKHMSQHLYCLRTHGAQLYYSLTIINAIVLKYI